MAHGSFHINNIAQEFSVIMEHISGDGNIEYPALSIPVKFDFTPLKIGTTSEIIRFELISFKADLRATEKNFKISEYAFPVSFMVNQHSSYNVTFAFPLSNDKVERIEKFRKQNLPLNISIAIQIGIYQRVQTISTNKQPIDQYFITGFQTYNCHGAFTIEQSRWVNNILPNISNKAYTLVELPLANQVIPDNYSVSLQEFQEARKYFINGDYDKTVAHCRAALDPFKNKDEFLKLKEFIKSKSEFEWANKVLDATDEWLDKMIKATSAFTSKPHHAPSVGHFGRTDAEIILMITTGVVAYVGKIGFKAVE